MIYSVVDVGNIELILDENTVIRSEPSVKALGVYIDYKLNFTEHVARSCTKAARQLNALLS